MFEVGNCEPVLFPQRHQAWAGAQGDELLWDKFTRANIRDTCAWVTTPLGNWLICPVNESPEWVFPLNHLGDLLAEDIYVEKSARST